MEKAKKAKFATFVEFWPFYLSEHSSLLNRRLHFIGSSLAILLVLYAFISLKPLFLLVAPIAGYAFAWAGHFIVEKNRPATFTYPLWSLRGDFKMFALMLTGRLDTELAKYRIQAT
jgi:hypothetical protein